MSSIFTLRQLALLFGLLFILASLVVPNSLISRIDILDIGDGLGVGQVQAQGDILPSTVGQATSLPIAYSENATHYIINNWTFVYTFSKEGYSDQILTLNNEVLVDYSEIQFRAATARLDKTGTATGESISAYEYEVVRTCPIETVQGVHLGLFTFTYNINLDKCKLTIEYQNDFRAITQDVTFRWVNGVISGDYSYENHRLSFVGDTSWIGIDWSDATEWNADYSVVPDGDTLVSVVTFDVGPIAAYEHIVIDPATVGTSTASTAIGLSQQRKIFYAASRYWVFYSDGNNMVYSSSLDETTWENATTVRACAVGIKFSIWWDGSYVHYALLVVGETDSVYYRRGLPSADGVITWGSEQLAWGGSLEYSYNGPTITTDNSGCPIIGVVGASFDYEWLISPYLLRSDNTTGGWSSSAGFPYQVEDVTSSSLWEVVPLVLGSDILAIYARDGQPIKSKYYNGSWGSENTTVLSIESASSFSAIVDSSDTVHIVFLEDTTGDIQYTYWSKAAGAWATEEEIYNGTSSTMAPVLSKTLDDNLYCFWAGDNTTDHIYYLTQSDGTWDTEPTDWLTESNITSNAAITSAYSQPNCCNNKIAVVWLTGSSSPYNVRFAAVEIALVEGMSITCTPNTFGFGTVRASTSNTTGLDYFTCNNTGSITVDIQICATNMIGTIKVWNLSDNAMPGDSTYGLEAGRPSSFQIIGFAGSENWTQRVGFTSDNADEWEMVGYIHEDGYSVTVKRTSPHNYIFIGLPPGGSFKWGLRFYPPTANIGNELMTGKVLLTASAHV